MNETAQTVLSFWFEEIKSEAWWSKDPAFDRTLAERFGALHRRAAAAELWAWRKTASGRLAEIIVLDQFSRNMFRDDPRAFAQDPAALVLAQEAVASGADRELAPERRAFFYMPYMHSESAVIQAESVKLFAQPQMEESLDFARRHKEIIDRFGRYPHRNAVLGRVSTAAELAFLKEPGSSF